MRIQKNYERAADHCLKPLPPPMIVQYEKTIRVVQKNTVRGLRVGSRSWEDPMVDLKDFERRDPVVSVLRSDGEASNAEQLCDKLIEVCAASGVSKFDFLAATCGLVITSVGQFNLRLAKQLAAYVYHATLASDWDDECSKDLDEAIATAKQQGDS